MTHTWILDVLTDLRTYAVENELPGLAAKLNETSVVAAVEISHRPPSPARAKTGRTDGSVAGDISGNLGTGR